MKSQTSVTRKSDREIVVSRTIDAAPRIVFEAWTKAELFKRWWVPKSFPISLLSCEMDVRVGGKYSLVFGAEPQPIEFFGKYLEVVPCSRLVWTNEEGGEEAAAITTVTFEERDGKTLLTMSDLHPSKEALDASGATDATAEVWDQLEELVVTLH
ncbi:MAG: SRPBCC domain-containing protein [Polyangiaceae bacterium]|nr:SRPBCC domain-containing protein [Polyangiaceae bacterium]